MMKVLNWIAFSSLFFLWAGRKNFNRNIVYTKLHPAKLFDSLSKSINLNGSIQFYYPYRGLKQNIMRVELDSPYSAIFDLTMNGNILIFNKESVTRFTTFANRFFNGDIYNAQQYIIGYIEKSKNYGVDAIAKGRNFILIQTMYMDSSYSLLKSVNKNYSDGFYLKLVEGDSPFKGYCIAFYYFDKEQDSLPFFSQNKVTMVNKKLFYYREPIRNIGNEK